MGKETRDYRDMAMVEEEGRKSERRDGVAVDGEGEGRRGGKEGGGDGERESDRQKERAHT